MDCPKCCGDGWVVAHVGYRVTGWGYGDCEEVFEVESCEQCEGRGEVSLEVVAVFLDGSEEVEASGLLSLDDARARRREALRFRYGSGGSEGAYLSHPSGILRMEIRQERR